MDTLIHLKENQYEFDYLDSKNIRITILLEEIFTDSSGNKYYKYVNPLQISKERQSVAEQAETFFMYNVTPSEFISKMTEIIENINKQQYLQAGGVAVDLRNRAMRLLDESCTLELAAIYFLIEGEHPGYYIPSIKDKKLLLWKEDGKARDFFLKTLLDFLKPYSELSSQDLVNYLSELKPTLLKAMPESPLSRAPMRYSLGKFQGAQKGKHGKQPAKTQTEQGN